MVAFDFKEDDDENDGCDEKIIGSTERPFHPEVHVPTLIVNLGDPVC